MLIEKSKSKRNIFEKLIFDIIFLNMFAIDAIYTVIPTLQNIYPSSFAVIIPIIACIIFVVNSIQKFQIISMREFVLLMVVLLYILLSVIGNSFIKDIVFSPDFLVMCVFGMFILSIGDLNDTISHIGVLSFIICCIYTALAYITGGSSIYNISTVYMKIGYGLSLQVIILLENGRRTNQKLLYACAIFFSVVIFAYGNRGALLIVISYTIIEIIISYIRNGYSKKIVITGILMLILSVIVLFSKQIVFFIGQIFQTMGISSRTYNRLLAGTFSMDVERTMIRNAIIENLKDNPFKIHGPGYLTTISLNGLYANAHNIELELLGEYGVIIGTILITILIVILCKALILKFKCGDILSVGIMFCLLLDAVIMLQFSGTFYSCKELWLGLIMYVYIQKRRNLILYLSENRET